MENKHLQIYFSSDQTGHEGVINADPNKGDFNTKSHCNYYSTF